MTEFLRGRFTGASKIADKHLAENPFMLGKRATIADLSMCGYMFYGEELPRAARSLHQRAEMAGPHQVAAGLEGSLRADARGHKG